MKLDPDCIRDILLSVEEVVAPRMFYEFPKNAETLIEKYTKEVTEYHLQQCIHHEFFTKATPYMGGGISIQDLSPAGHKFIANIREKTVWNGVKSVASKVGSTSLDAVVQIASNVITEIIKAQFGLSSQASI